MSNTDKIEAYYNKEGPFREGINALRAIVLKTELSETLKWGSPIYTVEGKNVLGIMSFKHHFGLWFFQGVFLSDPLKVLENASEGKTKAMRHWKFKSGEEIDTQNIQIYIKEAIENQRKGLVIKPSKKKDIERPKELINALESNTDLLNIFNSLSLAKQKEYYRYISEAKQAKTKKSRIQKILPLISSGKGLNDKYRS
ncbi:YdeI/OmpD-associated family protein [Eudoraea sp.]|uniref:YdeI/OmpD-associated family protein n=1 Tax=Eudoraea sp. TaxID=1979955 RepID=UPI003C7548F2